MLTKKQFTQVQTLIESLDESAEMISNRLVEALRRKNEALKRASKRERSDPMTHSVPSVSPCCLSDDSLPLRLLVKLGKTQEAATAYSARRSLLLLERCVRAMSKRSIGFANYLTLFCQLENSRRLDKHLLNVS